MAKKAWTTEKNDCPVMVWRTCRSVCRAFSERYRSTSCSWRPNTFASNTPDTDSDSCVIADMSESDAWVLAATRRRTRPTRICSTMNTGMSTNATSDSCQDSTSIATTDATTVTTLLRIDDAVSVTTDWTPATSLSNRDWITPVFVEVKNPRCMRWRWAKSRSRSPCITRLPRTVVR